MGGTEADPKRGRDQCASAVGQKEVGDERTLAVAADDGPRGHNIYPATGQIETLDAHGQHGQRLAVVPRQPKEGEERLKRAIERYRVDKVFVPMGKCPIWLGKFGADFAVAGGDFLYGLEGGSVEKSQFAGCAVNFFRTNPLSISQRPGRGSGGSNLGRLRGDVSRDMRLPRVLGQPVAALDEEASAVFIQGKSYRLRMLGIEQQGSADFEVLDLHRLIGMPQGRGGQGHFQESRGGKNGGAANLVVIEPSQSCRVEVVFPFPSTAVGPVAEQRMLVFAADQSATFDRHRQREVLVLPRIQRQVQMLGRTSTEDFRPVVSDSAEDELSGRFAKVGQAAGIAGYQSRGMSVDSFGLQCVLHVVGQHRVWTDLQEDAIAVRRGRRDCLAEKDRVTNVASPISCVGRVRNFRAGHRGIHRKLRLGGEKVTQFLLESGHNAVHLRTVKRVGEFESLEFEPAVRQHGFKRGQRLVVAGHGDAARAVLAGNDHPDAVQGRVG